MQARWKYPDLFRVWVEGHGWRDDPISVTIFVEHCDECTQGIQTAVQDYKGGYHFYCSAHFFWWIINECRTNS